MFPIKRVVIFAKKRKRPCFHDLPSRLTCMLVVYLSNSLLTKFFVAFHQAGSISKMHPTALMAVPTTVPITLSLRRPPHVAGLSIQFK